MRKRNVNFPLRETKKVGFRIHIIDYMGASFFAFLLHRLGLFALFLIS